MSTSITTPERRRSPSPPAFSSKFENLVTPPRRLPPTALRLVSGPLPTRSRPKHTLPSLPRPAFYPKVHLPRAGPTPRKRAKEAFTLQQDPPAIHLAREKFPPLKVPGYASGYSSSESDSDGETSPSSVSSFGSYSGPPSPVGEKVIRGPWVNAGAIKVPFDVTAVLPPPRRVAINIAQRA